MADDNRKGNKKKEKAPRRHYRQSDEGIDNSTLASPVKSRSSGNSKPASRPSSGVAALKDDSLDDRRNGTSPRPLDTHGSMEPATTKDSSAKASLSRAEQDRKSVV